MPDWMARAFVKYNEMVAEHRRTAAHLQTQFQGLSCIINSILETIRRKGAITQGHFSIKQKKEATQMLDSDIKMMTDILNKVARETPNKIMTKTRNMSFLAKNREEKLVPARQQEDIIKLENDAKKYPNLAKITNKINNVFKSPPLKYNDQRQIDKSTYPSVATTLYKNKVFSTKSANNANSTLLKPVITTPKKPLPSPSPTVKLISHTVDPKLKKLTVQIPKLDEDMAKKLKKNTTIFGKNQTQQLSSSIKESQLQPIRNKKEASNNLEEVEPTAATHNNRSAENQSPLKNIEPRNTNSQGTQREKSKMKKDEQRKNSPVRAEVV